MRHLTDETLWAVVDDSLPDAEQREMDEHLAACAECRSWLARARQLQLATARAPRAIEPPEELWSGIRARIDAGRVVPLGERHRTAMPGRQWSRWWLAAAALLLVVLSSSVTALLLRTDGSRLTGELAVRTDTQADGEALPRFVATDEQERMERELTALLEAQRATLTPETVAKIERNLDVIDAAIEEIKMALAEDPNNRALHDLLSSSYRQKAALLKQASQI
ncbi:MAG TPA: zf-HC2 domain-containing protein [Gemmatimonadaceae bacterium]|nr:zf-HC2 domain-containing protein [Gemmatimonadaceae bacterium]